MADVAVPCHHALEISGSEEHQTPEFVVRNYTPRYPRPNRSGRDAICFGYVCGFHVSRCGFLVPFHTPRYPTLPVTFRREFVIKLVQRFLAATVHRFVRPRAKRRFVFSLG
jgi:hypothetical protein